MNGSLETLQLAGLSAAWVKMVPPPKNENGPADGDVQNGSACAFFCAAQSGFISGQNLQLDGGSCCGLV